MWRTADTEFDYMEISTICLLLSKSRTQESYPGRTAEQHSARFDCPRQGLHTSCFAPHKRKDSPLLRCLHLAAATSTTPTATLRSAFLAHVHTHKPHSHSHSFKHTQHTHWSHAALSDQLTLLTLSTHPHVDTLLSLSLFKWNLSLLRPALNSTLHTKLVVCVQL